jgi:hypothetical protein
LARSVDLTAPRWPAGQASDGSGRGVPFKAGQLRLSASWPAPVRRCRGGLLPLLRELLGLSARIVTRRSRRWYHRDRRVDGRRLLDYSRINPPRGQMTPLDSESRSLNGGRLSFPEFAGAPFGGRSGLVSGAVPCPYKGEVEIAVRISDTIIALLRLCMVVAASPRNTHTRTRFVPPLR